ncbi:WD40 repeat-containing protein [Rivularia sp. PCC 7116]|uniref:AAA-like domain-containing protein n=1 Tax=Rivularia sp. PCC 7116 TaxID=373994 RepID=UPI00029F3021|nr:AAA-like domain-containing protein [Rivularia sp. PCC 7116]AFY58453.1 WD40 repeat-containing protein [Rivularia sp. PCC 7116]
MTKSIYSLGGTVQASKGIYIRREADEVLLELCGQGEFAYILTSRQMGKSSLMISTASELKKIGVKSVIIDLTKIGTQVTVEQWYLGLLLEIEEQLDLDTDVDEWWEANDHVGFTQRLSNFFQQVLLEEVESSVVVFVDEIDTTLSLDFTDDFFAAIRYLYVARAQDDKFERLSFVLIGVATPGDLIRDAKRTPFNVGKRLDLTDFTVEEAMPLAEGLGLTSKPAEELLKCVLEWTGGHPYLTQRLCSVISEQHKKSWSNAAVKQVVSNTFLGAMSKQDNNLQFVRDMLTKRAPNQEQVLTAYREIRLASHPVVDEEQSNIKSHLKLSGVVRRQDDSLVVRNRIYQEVFNADWVEKELAQQRPYSQALMAWLETKEQDESRLLRGQALQDALAWAKDKSLGNVDYQFLAASQELDKREIQFALAETKKQAEVIVADAQRKAKWTTSIGLGILTVAITGAIGVSWYARRLKNLQQVTVLEQTANWALRLFDSYEITALFIAMETGQKLQTMVKDNRPGEYPAANPVSVLQSILNDIRERNQLKAHTKALTSARFSPDGKRILTASEDGTAIIWNSDGKELAVLKGHTGRVYSAVFSPDGKRILSASEDKTARIWNSDGKELAVFKGHTGRVYSAIFSPDGKRILTASEDKTARIWDSSGKKLAVLKGHTEGVNSAIFSRDGKRIITASEDGTARIWNTDGKELAVLKGHTGRVYSAIFSPDDKRILTASEDKTARIWDSSGKELAVLKGHTEGVTGAKFSPNGELVLTASDDNTAQIWDISGKKLAVLKGHTSGIITAKFSDDGRRILTASDDGTARIWNPDGEELAVLKGHTERVISASFNSENKNIITASGDNSARIWDEDDKELVFLKGHTKGVKNARFSADGKRILTASEDKTARIWDSSGKELAVLKGHTGSVYSARFSNDGKRILTASEDGTARIWNSSGNELFVLKNLTKGTTNARFSPDGKHITTAYEDGTARIWHTSGKKLAVLKGHTKLIKDARFSDRGKRIVTASRDKTTRIWDSSGKELAVLTGHTDTVLSARFSNNGKYVLTASWDNTARVWNTNGKELAVLKGHTKGVYSARFSPDGKYILTASEDGTARIWNSSGKELAVLKGHTGSVYSAMFSDDGKRILTTSRDKTARIWDSSGKELAVLKGHTGSVYSARFSDDGKRILTASEDGTARIWQIEELDNLLKRGCEWLDDYLVVNAQYLRKLKVCQTPSNIKAAAPYLVKIGEEKAQAVDIKGVNGAIETFKTALKWNPELKFDPQKKVQAIHLVSKGAIFVREKKIKEAIAAYKQAQKIDAKVEIDADAWNNLCGQGSLNEFAKEVMFACENAVKLAPDSGAILDSRGLARALTGNYKGAILDFEAFIAKSSDEKEKDIKAQRQGWLKALREGKNPFTKEELEKLRSE